MNPIITYTLTYALLLLLFLGLVQFLTNGFFFTFMKVKASRGKKVLIEVRSKLETYSVVGTIEEGFLLFKDRPAKAEGKTKRLKLPNNAVYRKFNLNFVGVDEEKNSILIPSETEVAGFDPIKFEGLHVRALMTNNSGDITKFLKIVLILCVVIIIALIVVHVRIQELSKIIEAGISVVGVV